jgi:hypothetical protein
MRDLDMTAIAIAALVPLIAASWVAAALLVFW